MSVPARSQRTATMTSLRFIAACIALALRTKTYSRGHDKVAVVTWSVGMAKYELDNYDEAMKYLRDFVKIQDAKKIRNVDYVIALQVIGDIHQFLDNRDSASSAWSAAFHTYSSSKDLVSSYPVLGPMLERRLTSCGEDEEAEPSSPDTIFQTITAGLVGQLSEEVNKKLDRDPAEATFQRAIFLED